MKIKTLPFFEGVALAALSANVSSSTAVLSRDAQLLAQTCNQRGLSMTGDFAPTVDPAKIAAQWMKYRRRKPSGPFDPQFVLEGQPAEGDNKIIEISQVAQTVQDKDFVSLFSGALVGLESLQPGILATASSESQWEFAIQKYGLYRADYVKNGVPTHAAGLLFTLEFVDSLISNPLGPFLWRNYRYGYLKVKTDPAAANIWVDDHDWGASPQERGIPAGKHEVVAKKKKLSAQKSVKVEPAFSSVVALYLS